MSFVLVSLPRLADLRQLDKSIYKAGVTVWALAQIVWHMVVTPCAYIKS